jgi:ketopantoate reductase
MIAVKSYDTDSMVRQVAPLLKADGFALSLQNGLWKSRPSPKLLALSEVSALVFWLARKFPRLEG